MTVLAACSAPATRPSLRLVVEPGWPAALQPVLPWAGAVPPSTPAVSVQDERAVHALCRALVEALAGRRPASQLRPALPTGAYRLVAALAHAGAATGLQWVSGRVQCPRSGVVEASLHLAGPTRSAAVAVRLARGPAGWRCCALELALDEAGVRRWPRGTS